MRTTFDEKLSKLKNLPSIEEKHKMVYMWIKQGKLSLKEYTKIMSVILYM